MARIAAMKKVLSPISETRITDRDSTKPCKKPKRNNNLLSQIQDPQINHSTCFQIAPLCSVTLKAGSSVMLMFVTPVASGIHVGSIFSGLGSMSETYGEGFQKNVFFREEQTRPHLTTVRHLC